MLTFKPLKKYKNSAKLAWKTTFYLKQTVASLEFLVSVTHWIDGVFGFLIFLFAMLIVFDTQVTDVFGGLSAVFRYSAAPLMIASIFSMLVGALGIGAVATKSRKSIVKGYFIFMIICITCEIFATALAALLNNDQNINASFVGVISSEYGRPFENKATKYWDTLHTNHNCCGYNSGLDFSGSFFEFNSTLTWPPSCCKTKESKFINKTSCLGRNTWNSINSNVEKGCKSFVLEKADLMEMATATACLLHTAWHIFAMILFLVMHRKEKPPKTDSHTANQTTSLLKRKKKTDYSRSKEGFYKTNSSRQILHSRSNGFSKDSNDRVALYSRRHNAGAVPNRLVKSHQNISRSSERSSDRNVLNVVAQVHQTSQFISI